MDKGDKIMHPVKQDQEAEKPIEMVLISKKECEDILHWAGMWARNGKCYTVISDG